MADMYFENLPSTNTPLIASNLDKLNDIKVSATEPNTGEKVWLQKGKNLFDGNNNFLKVGLWSSGDVIAANSFGYYVVCPIEGGRTYTISKKNTTGGIYCASTATYPKDGTAKVNAWQGASDVNSLVYQTSSAAKYLFIGLFGGSPTDAQKSQCIEELMVEQGTTATTYEAYIEPKIYVKNNNNIYEDIDFLQSLQGVVLWTSASTGAKGEMQLDVDLTNFEAYQVLYNAWNNMLPNNLIATGKLLKEYPYLLINYTGHYRTVWYNPNTKKIVVSAIDGGSEASFDSVPFKIIGFRKF